MLGDDPWNVIKVLDPDGAWADTVRLRPSEPSTGEETPGTYRYARGLSVVPFWPRGARTLDPRGFFWAVPPNMNEYRAPTILGDRFYTLHTDELGVPYVVRARIRESGTAVGAGGGRS